MENLLTEEQIEFYEERKKAVEKQEHCGKPYALITNIEFKRVIMHIEGELRGVENTDRLSARFVTQNRKLAFYPQHFDLDGNHFHLTFNIMSVNGEKPINSGNYHMVIFEEYDGMENEFSPEMLAESNSETVLRAETVYRISYDENGNVTEKIKLTNEGLILRKRAEEIIELMKKAQDEIKLSDEILAGDIYIGAGESVGVRELIKVIKKLKKENPLIHLHIVSGDKTTVLEDLNHGLIDFALVFGQVDYNRYDSLLLKSFDYFGVMMRKDDPLAIKDIIKPEDLFNKPLILSRQLYKDNNISELLNCDRKKLNIVGTYNLLFNASLMVSEGMGYAFALDKIINVTGESNLCYRPLYPALHARMFVIWKKYQVLSKASEKFYDSLYNDLTQN